MRGPIHSNVANKAEYPRICQIKDINLINVFFSCIKRKEYLSFVRANAGKLSHQMLKDRYSYAIRKIVTRWIFI